MALLHITSKEEFTKQILEASQVALVDFWATWCGPCKMQGPIIEELANELTDVVIAKVDVDVAAEIAKEYRIMSIPTLALFKGGKEVERLVGLRSKEDLLAELNTL